MRGWLLTIFAALFFAVRTAFMKLVSLELAPSQALFLQNGMAFVIWLPIAGAAGLSWPKTTLFPHIARAFAEGSMLYLAYLLLVTMPTEHVTLLTLWGPLFVPLFFWISRSRRTPILQGWGLVLGWLGLVAICALADMGSYPDRFLTIAIGLFGATSLIATGKLRTQESPHSILLWGHALPTVAFFFLAVPGWIWPSGRAWVLLVFIALLSLAFAYLLLHTSRPGQPFGGLMYTAVAFSLIADWLYWNYLPGTWFAIGALLVIGGCALIVTSLGQASTR